MAKKVEEISLKDSLHPSIDDGCGDISTPIEPPEYEVFAHRLVANAGTGAGYVLKSYKEANLDPLVHSLFREWADVPAIVKGRVRHLMRSVAADAVASRREVEEFLTQVIRADARLDGRKDRRRLDAMEAVKELCKMRGYYSPVEIRNTHEIVVPDAIRRMSDEQLLEMANAAKADVIDVEPVEEPVLVENGEDEEGGEGDGGD